MDGTLSLGWGANLSTHAFNIEKANVTTIIAMKTNETPFVIALECEHPKLLNVAAA